MEGQINLLECPEFAEVGRMKNLLHALDEKKLLVHLLDKTMDAAGVHGALIHPPSWDPDSHALAIEACRQHGKRFAILGRIPLDQPHRRGEIETWRQQPGMVGLRYTFLQPHMKSWPSDGTMDWLWPAAERLGLSVALLAGEFLPLALDLVLWSGMLLVLLRKDQEPREARMRPLLGAALLLVYLTSFMHAGQPAALFWWCLGALLPWVWLGMAWTQRKPAPVEAAA